MSEWWKGALGMVFSIGAGLFLWRYQQRASRQKQELIDLATIKAVVEGMKRDLDQMEGQVKDLEASYKELLAASAAQAEANISQDRELKRIHQGIAGMRDTINGIHQLLLNNAQKGA